MAGSENRAFFGYCGGVLLSVVFSRFDILKMVYLVPVLAVCVSRKGAGRIVPVVAVGLLANAISLLQLRQGFASAAGIIAICISVFLPAVIWISSLVWISVGGKSMMRRYLAGAFAGAFVALVFLLFLLRGGDAVMKVDHAMQEQFISFFSSFNLGGTVDEGVILASNLSRLYRAFVLVLGCMIVPISMFFAGLNQFIALCMALRGDNHFSRQVSEFFLPERAIWLFLGAWAFVCAGYFVRLSYPVMALLLNFAMGVSLLYGFQGFAIILYRSRMHKEISASSLFWRLFIIMAFIPLANTLLMFALPLLGVTETWIQYRKPKELSI